MNKARHSKSNPIKLNFIPTQSNSIHGLSLIEFNNQAKSNSLKRKNQSNPNECSIFELMICVTQALKIHHQIVEARVTWAQSVAHVFFRKQRNLAEMASDVLWIVSFNCVVKGYQECH